jgi:hypothetical protein
MAVYGTCISVTYYFMLIYYLTIGTYLLIHSFSSSVTLSSLYRASAVLMPKELTWQLLRASNTRRHLKYMQFMVNVLR